MIDFMSYDVISRCCKGSCWRAVAGNDRTAYYAPSREIFIKWFSE
jgi:hypothetical protein